MVLLGFVGMIGSLIIIIFGHIGIRKILSDDNKIFFILTYIFWILNFLACLEWAFYRTNLFMTLNKTRCTFIYVSNFLFYMFAKCLLQMLLLCRLHVTVKHTK